MSEWKVAKAEEILDVQNGYAFKSKHFHESEGIPVIKIKNVASGELDMNDVQFYPLSVDGLERYFINDGDILIALTGSHISQPSSVVGRVARYYNNEMSLLNQRVGKIYSLNNKIADENFVYWYFKQWDVTQELALNAGGSANQANISGKLIKSLDILLPSLPEQHAIATVLSSLDDKIDLLHRQNATLEALAETLFRQWFVEEAGEDWDDGELGDLIKLEYGKGLKKSIRSGSGYPVVGSSGILDYHEDFLVEAPGIVIGRKGTLGETIYLTENFHPIDTTFYIKSKSGSSGLYFEYFLLKNIGFEQMNSDSAVPGLNRNHAHNIELPIPPIELIKEFNNTAEPFFDKINYNKAQLNKLEKLRDTLLPKLMSGEVKVKFEEEKKKPANVIPLKKKQGNLKFREAILISAIVRAFYAPKIGSVSRQWYQKISYLHKRKMNDESAMMYELLEEYGKKSAGPYKREMRYHGPEGITLSNEYLEAVGKKAFKPAKHIEQIDKYFYEHDYWNWNLFQNWTLPNLAYKSVKKLGVWATIDYCLLELKQSGKELSKKNVLQFISESKEWKHKIKQPEFSPENVEEAIQELFGMYSY